MATNSTTRGSVVDGSAVMNYAAVAVAVGGLLGLAGVYLNWFRYSYGVTGGTIDVYLRGSEDWTGQVAFIAAIAAFAFGVANIVLPDPQIRRLTAGLMGVAAVLLLGACIAGLLPGGRRHRDRPGRAGRRPGRHRDRDDGHQRRAPRLRGGRDLRRGRGRAVPAPRRRPRLTRGSRVASGAPLR